MPRTKEQIAAYQRQWAINNKEKIAKKQADYYQANKERIQKRDEAHKERKSAYNKQYRENHKEQIAENNKQWRENNQEHCLQYREDNKERTAERDKEYKTTPNGIRVRAVADWKRQGITPPKDMTLHDVYDNIYLPCTHCMVCKNEFKNRTDKTADHNHDLVENNFRQVLCQNCNINDNWMNKI